MILASVATFVSALSSFEIAHFRSIWLGILLTTALFGFWFAARGRHVSRTALVLDSLSKRDWQLLCAFVLIVAAYIFLILYKEDFADYDNSILTCFSLNGKNRAPAIWPSDGRFFPLGDQEFNILKFVTRSPTGYHLFAVAELAVLLTTVFFILRDVSVVVRLCSMTLLLVTPSFLICFTGLIYPERNLVTLLGIFVLALQSFTRRGAPIAFACALVAVHGVLYYKEPVFIMIAAFVGARLLSGWLQCPPEAAWARARRGARAHTLDLAMLALVGVFVCLLLLAIVPHGGSGYSNKMREHRSLWSLCLAYLQIDVLLAIFPVCFVLRAFHLWRERRAPDPVWDALAFSSLVYALVVLALRLYQPYYMAPTDFIGVLYLAWLSGRWKYRRSLVALACLVAAQDIAFSSFLVIERKNTVEGKARLAAWLMGRRHDGIATTRLFLPYATPYRVMELAAFFAYKGLRLPTDESPGTSPEVELVLPGPALPAYSPCVDYRPFLCEHVPTPASGDLVVLLPDDPVPAGATPQWEEKAKLVFLHLPTAAPRIALPAFSLLRAVSPFFSHEPLPREWLELRVFTLP